MLLNAKRLLNLFIGPGGRFRMSPALAAAQKADIQASLLGYTGSFGSGASFVLTPNGKCVIRF